MKNLYFLSLSLLVSLPAFSKVHNTPKLPYEYEVCQAVHAGECWDKKDMAVINCESDLNQVCKTLDEAKPTAVPESLVCKKLDLSFTTKVKSTADSFIGLGFEAVYKVFQCGLDGCEDNGIAFQMMMVPGEEVVFYNISADGKKELDGERIRNAVDVKTYDMKNDHKTQYISKIKCN